MNLIKKIETRSRNTHTKAPHLIRRKRVCFTPSGAYHVLWKCQRFSDSFLEGTINTSAASAPQGAPASASTAPPLTYRSLATCFICLRLQLAKVLKLQKI